MRPEPTRVKVRFHHMDRAGMIFHGAYAEFFQDAFEDLMEQCGFNEKEVEGRLGLRLPVVRHEMEFPAIPEGDGLEVDIAIEKVGRTSAAFRLTARDPRGTVTATAAVTRVCIGVDGRPVPIPEALRKAWEPWVHTN